MILTVNIHFIKQEKVNKGGKKSLHTIKVPPKPTNIKGDLEQQWNIRILTGAFQEEKTHCSRRYEIISNLK